MLGSNTEIWNALEEHSTTLFLAAGALLVVFAALLGVEAFMDTTAPEDIFGPPGFLLAMLGVAGISLTLADQAPRLARGTAVLAGVSAVGWLLITLTSIAETLAILPPLEEMGPLGMVVVMAGGLPMLLAYLLAGGAAFQTGTLSRTVALLLLVPPLVFALMLSGVLQTFLDQATGAFVLGSLQALSNLGIGLALRAEGAPAGATGPAAPPA